jgi:enolase
VYHSLKAVIKAKYGQDACNVGDEGGFAPNIASNREGAELLVEACKKSGHTDKVCVCMHAATVLVHTVLYRVVYPIDCSLSCASYTSANRRLH